MSDRTSTIRVRQSLAAVEEAQEHKLDRVSWLSRKIHGFLATIAPSGYQDETGFHFGTPVTRGEAHTSS